MVKRHALIAQAWFLVFFFSFRDASEKAGDTGQGDDSRWHGSLQYLGLTWHPGGGGNAEVYPLKLDGKGYLVPEVGAAANLDFRLNGAFFFRFTASLYKDCAFVTAGCLHAGPRIQYVRGRNSVNMASAPS